MRLASVLLLFALAATVLAGPAGGEFALDVVAADEAGGPVAGARVEAFAVRAAALDDEDAATWDEVLDPARRPRTPDASAASGADGRARVEGLSPMRWTIVASAPGRAAERRTVVLPGFRGPLRLTLRAARPLDGRVVDQLGAPIAGATVVVAWGPTHNENDAPRVSPFDAWTRADAEGRWHIEDVPDEVVRVHASPPGVWSDYARAILTLDARRFDLELDLRGPIVGTVRDAETKRVVPGAVVEVCEGLGWTGRVFTRVTADGAGRYSIPLWPERGISSVRARVAGLRPADPDLGRDIGPKEVSPFTFDTLVRAGAMLRGRVIDAGEPVAGAVVWLRDDHGMNEVVSTDAAGRYAFAARPGGQVFVGVAAPGANPAELRGKLRFSMSDRTAERDLTLPARGDVDLDLPAAPPPPGPRLHGVVVDEDDEPVRYAEVATAQGRTARTGQDGFFTLPRSGEGAVTLNVTKKGFRSVLHREIGGDTATAERPLVVRVEHERRVRVRGTVKGADGRPVQGGRVALRLAALSVDWQKDPFRIRPGWGDWTPLGADGSFDVAIGQDRDTIVNLAVVAPGCAPASFDVPEAVDGAVPAMDVRLDSGATIRGRVVSAATKKPVAGARIVLQPDSLRFMSHAPAPVTYAATGDDGSFVIRDLPPGRIGLTAVAPALGEDQRDVVIGSGGERTTITADFVLPATGQEFRNGRVPPWIGPPHATLVDEAGAPLAGWTVEGYADPDRTHLDRKTLVRATSDAEGKFEFPGTRSVVNLLAYPPAAAKGGPRELYPPQVPPYSEDETCKTYRGEIVSFEIVDEDGAIATDIAYTMVDAPGGRRGWSERSDGRYIFMSELPPDARVTLHVEKPGCEPIDVKDVPAGTARMRLVLKRTAPK